MAYIGVKFREHGLIYYFDAQDQTFKKGDQVVVATEEGLGMARVALVREDLPDGLNTENIKPIERRAEEADLQVETENRRIGKEAFAFCKSRIRDAGLEMKLVDVEVRFDRSKMIFYFTAPSRVDFRDLIKTLVSEYRTRIELRQIGVRHEAQILGGIGDCGRGCCCSTFLRRFDPVTIKMAKEQQLFLNPSKISGCCGRLLCCLNFEKDFYSDFYKKCPRIGKKYQTSAGELKVLRANIFQDSLVVDVGGGEEKEISLPEWQELMSNQGNGSFLKPLQVSTSQGQQANGAAREQIRGQEPSEADDQKPVPDKDTGETGRKKDEGAASKRRGKAPGGGRRKRRKSKPKK